MTEAEWLACEEPTSMLESLRDKASSRKLRLFACACCRDHRPETPDLNFLQAYLVAERFADGQATEEERDAIFRLTSRTARDRYRSLRRTEIHEVACWDSQYRFSMLVGFAVGSRADDLETHITAAYRATLAAPRRGRPFPNRANHPTYLRDIFGNPFRPVAFSPTWRTDTAATLAKQMYESREFSAMPILADALQDAGCDNEDVLNHCRGDGPHVRGC